MTDEADPGGRDSRACDAREADDESVDFSRFPVTRERRVRFCLGLMAANRWTKGVTGREIAGATGVSVSTMKSIAGEAWRRFQTAVDALLVRQQLAIAMQEGVGIGLAAARPKTKKGARGRIKKLKGDLFGLTGAAACAKTLAALVGAEAPKKHEVTGANGAPLVPGTNITITDLSEEQLQAFVERGEVPKPK